MNPSPRFTLHHLEVLVAVGETGTVSGAAERLHMAPSSVSAAITELEGRLGTTLMMRKRAKGITLTATGESTIAQARVILQHATDLQLEASGGGDVVGPLRLGCFPSLAPTALPQLVTDFLAEHPRVTVDFREGDQTALRTWLATGEVDVGVMYDIESPPEWHITRIGSTTMMLVLSAEHPLAHAQRPIDMAEVADDPMVMLERPPSQIQMLAVCARAGFTPEVVYRTPSYETVRSFVARGLGWSLLLQRPRGDLSYEGLPLAVKEIGTPHPEPVDVAIVHIADRPLGRPAQAFVDHVVAQLDGGTAQRHTLGKQP